MLEENITYASSNGQHDIVAKIWKPDNSDDIVAILQIAHGMTEHKDRYAEFANFLVGKGFLVCANDHAGHGQSVKELYGYMGEENGHMFMLQDMRSLHLLVCSKYSAKPYFILGHSMGAFLSRIYARYFIKELNGAIFSGTTNGLPCINSLCFIFNILVKFRNGKRQSKFFTYAMLLIFNIKFRAFRATKEWISCDTKIVESYLSDKLCNFTFTYCGYRDLFMALKESSRKCNYDLDKKDLPIFIFSGKQDPVGMFSKGVIKLHRELISNGYTNVRLKLYEDGRHEMLNEVNRADVYEDIYAWLISTLG